MQKDGRREREATLRATRCMHGASPSHSPNTPSQAYIVDLYQYGPECSQLIASTSEADARVVDIALSCPRNSGDTASFL
jgi:hypothetical protein